jgi:hypothetical protein
MQDWKSTTYIAKCIRYWFNFVVFVAESSNVEILLLRCKTDSLETEIEIKFW